MGDALSTQEWGRGIPGIGGSGSRLDWRYATYILRIYLKGCPVRTTIGKWGNSLGVRIPAGLAADAHLQDGAEVEITLRDNTLVIAPVVSLAELVSRITPENLPELSDDRPRGGELW